MKTAPSNIESRERSWVLNGPTLTLELLQRGYTRATLLGHAPHTLRACLGFSKSLGLTADMFDNARIHEDAAMPARTADFISSYPGMTSRCRITWNRDADGPAT